MKRYERNVRIGGTLEQQIIAIFDDGTVQRTTYVRTADQPWPRLSSVEEIEPGYRATEITSNLLERQFRFVCEEIEHEHSATPPFA
jgi:hypothetical protein